MYVANQSVIAKEVELTMRFGENKWWVRRVLFVYTFLEDYYFIFVNISFLLLVENFCYSIEKNLITSFAVFFSILPWIQIAVGAFSIVFMALAGIFYVLYKIFSCSSIKN